MTMQANDGYLVPHTITLRVLDGIWHATHSGESADDVVRLFGTDTLPTPFTHETNAERVLVRIQALNPNAIVILVPNVG